MIQCIWQQGRRLLRRKTLLQVGLILRSLLARATSSFLILNLNLIKMITQRRSRKRKKIKKYPANTN